MKEIKLKIPLPEFTFDKELAKKIKVIASILDLIGVAVAGIFFDFTIIGELILAYLILALIWNISSRISTFLALFLLLITPILLLFSFDLGERTASSAYYFLIITIIIEIFKTNKVKFD